MDISNFKNIINSIGKKVFSASGKYTHSDNTDMGKYSPAGTNYFEPSFNAIEIDWNGYQVDSKYGVSSIDDTEDLFTYIKGLVNYKSSNPMIHYTPSTTNYTNVHFGNSSVKVDAKGHIVGY